MFEKKKTLSLPATPTSALERVQGKARPQVKMTSVSVCTRARGFRVGHLELESDRCPRAPLPPRGLCSRLPEGPQREESAGPPSGPSAPASLSDGGGGGAHQSCSPQADSGSRSPGEESRRGPPGYPARRGGCVRSGPVSERRAGAAPPRPRDSTPRPQPGSPRRRAQPAPPTPTQHHGRDRVPARLPGTRRPPPPGFPAAPRPREWRDRSCSFCSQRKADHLPTQLPLCSSPAHRFWMISGSPAAFNK